MQRTGILPRMLRLETERKRGLVAYQLWRRGSRRWQLLSVVKLATASDAYNGRLLDYRAVTNKDSAINVKFHGGLAETR